MAIPALGGSSEALRPRGCAARVTEGGDQSDEVVADEDAPPTALAASHPAPGPRRRFAHGRAISRFELTARSALAAHRRGPPDSGSEPRPCAHHGAPRGRRSALRTSWSRRYSSPRLVPRRPATTSIGTPPSAMAQRSSRSSSKRMSALRARIALTSAAFRRPSARLAAPARRRDVRTAPRKSRPAQARRRARTAASLIANLAAQVEKRLWPR